MHKAGNSKRQAILEAAKRVFIAHGYSGASMEAIAEAAPVSKPTLYNHFKGKQELFAAVIEGLCGKLLATLDGVQTELSDPVAGLTAIAEAFVDLIYAEESMQLYRLIIAEQQNFPELGHLIFRTGASPVSELMMIYLSELQARGVLRIDDMDLSRHTFLDMLKGEPHMRSLLGLQSGLEPGFKQRLIKHAVTIFLRGHGYEI